MKTFTTLAFAAILSATMAEPDFPDGSICCRAYTQKKMKGDDFFDFCITD